MLLPSDWYSLNMFEHTVIVSMKNQTRSKYRKELAWCSDNIGAEWGKWFMQFPDGTTLVQLKFKRVEDALRFRFAQADIASSS
jgi:hypothetical protein